jgi:hypothetical protein
MFIPIVVMPIAFYAECREYVLYAECHYAECRYVKCRYAECRGAKKSSQVEFFCPPKSKQMCKSTTSQCLSFGSKNNLFYQKFKWTPDTGKPL